MRMEQYLTNTDYALWQVIMNGDEPIQTTKDENDVETKKTVLKQQFEIFYVSDTKGLDKAYDRFQKLINLLEVHGAAVSNEDANQKFLRALPSSWNNVALIMRNKTSIDDLDIDDLYNNLKVPYSQGQTSSSIYTDDLMFLFFANQLNIPQLMMGEDLEQIDHDDLEEMDLNGSQLSTKDKTGLGYGDQLNERDSEVIYSVFDSCSSDGDDNQTNDRFKKGNEYHAIPPPLTGNYMPPLADLSFAGLDDSVYRPTANKASASISNGEESVTPPSNTSVEMHRVESVRPSGVIIEDWDSDDDEDIFQSNDS
ncbi:hypothetical protein Tco_1156579 [Tanacetum coccineum]